MRRCLDLIFQSIDKALVKFVREREDQNCNRKFDEPGLDGFSERGKN